MYTERIKSWFRDRPMLDINVCAVWFLMSFVYMQGASNGETIFHFGISGLVPVVTIPYLNEVMIWVCLAASAIILVEPLLPSGLSSRTIACRKSPLGKYIFGLNVYTAFTIGFLSGVITSIETFFHSPWLVNGIVVFGFIIFLVMTIKLPLSMRNLRKSKQQTNEEQD